jgi:1,5-anhydro-D-fructose reductase (1,5-anhydro-D-mannitol-forming)
MLKIAEKLRKKLKWGVAGCGKFTEIAFLPTIKLLRKSSVQSVYSKDPARVKYITEKFSVSNGFTDYDEFLKSDIDAVYIGSVNSDHYEQVIKAARAGKHILCEKPISITSAQAEEMVRVCKENNVQLTINYTQRFHPIVLKAKEIIDSQMLGKLVSVQINFNINLAPGDSFRFQKELSGGGALRDLGTHCIDLMRYLVGEITEIDGIIDDIIYKSEVDDFALGHVKFEKGGYGSFNVSYNNKKGFNRVEILGYTGALSIDNLIAGKHSSAKMTILLDGEAKKAFRKRGHKLQLLLKSVQKSFLNNETPAITGNDGLINLKLMEELERKCLQKKN